MKYTVGLSTEIPVVCPFSVTNQRHLITRFFNCCKYQYYGYNYCFYYHLWPTTSDGTCFNSALFSVNIKLMILKCSDL